MPPGALVFAHPHPADDGQGARVRSPAMTSRPGTRPRLPGMGSTTAPNQRWQLAVRLTMLFMYQAAATIVSVAIPSIRADLGASGAELELVIGGYLLASAGLLIPGARLGYLRGYRRVFLAGLGVFGAASLACGLAPDPVVLVAGRVVQGIGGALAFPQVLTGIQLHVEEGPPRTRALSLYSVALAGGAGRRHLLRAAVHARAVPAARSGPQRAVLRAHAGSVGRRVRGARADPRPPASRARPLLPCAGCLILAAAYAGLSVGMLTGERPAALLLALLAVGGLGLGTAFRSIPLRLTTAATPRYAADISGVFTTSLQIAGSIGVAAFGSLYLAQATSPGPAAATRAFGIVTPTFPLVPPIPPAAPPRAPPPPPG